MCAEWCGVCREWRDVFTQAAATYPQLRFAWIDVEDEADAMGDVDIETFPTLLIARESKPLFYGPVLPSGTQFTRLISSVQDAPATASVSEEAASLLQSLMGRILSMPSQGNVN